MLDAVDLAPGDRVLLLSPPAPAALERVSARIAYGVAVVITDRDRAAELRKSALHLENVMFVPATLDEIPWQDGYFNWILDDSAGWPPDPLVHRELLRALAPGGRLSTRNSDVTPLIAAGCEPLDSPPGCRQFRKPLPPPQPLRVLSPESL